MTERPVCCQALHDHVASTEAKLAQAEADRQPPATISDADYLDAMRAVRLARQVLADHERWHRREGRRRARLTEAEDAFIKATATSRDLEARLSSYALADALRTFEPDEPRPLIGDAERVHPRVIVGAIYSHYADTGHWPTMHATAARVAAEMGATYAAARQAVSANVQGAYHAVQTVVLVPRGEAVSEGDDDVWRLMPLDEDMPRLAFNRELADEYDEMVETWRAELLEGLGS